MRDENFAGLREYADNAVRQPDFAVVRQRAGRVRRRRAVASSVTAAVAALAATGLGYAAVAGPQTAVPTPSVSVQTDPGWPRVNNVVATGSAALYAVYERCRDCDSELYASDDAGVTWQRRTVPPMAEDAGVPRSAAIVSLGRGVLAWRDYRVLTLPGLRDLSSPQPSSSGSASLGRLWTTVDGGRTWRHGVVDPKPVAAVPAGTRPVDCALIGQGSPCRVYAVDPVDGGFAPLADQPSGITVSADWTGQTDVPLGAGLWVPGLDPATQKPAVASSSDGGRTWRTHVFTAGVPAETVDGSIAAMYLPTVAAGPDGTAYALTHRADLRMDSYRTIDGGVTWRSGASVAEVPDAGFVTTDGAHVVKTGQQFRVSRNGGGYQPVTLPGYPDDLRQLTQVTSHQAAGCYLVFSISRLFISADGWTWRQVNLP